MTTLTEFLASRPKNVDTNRDVIAKYVHDNGDKGLAKNFSVESLARFA